MSKLIMMGDGMGSFNGVIILSYGNISFIRKLSMLRILQSKDFIKLSALMDLAFAPSKYESRLVNQMSTIVSNEICGWVHVEGEEILGGILYTAATRNGKPIGWHLAPLAVHPLYQRRGIGSCLVRESLSSPLLSSASIFVLGSTKYYPKFGFVGTNIPSCVYDPGNQHFMALRWTAPIDQFIVGYCEAFKIADQTPEDGISVSQTTSASSANESNACADTETYLHSAANELVAIVDRENNVIGSALRCEMRSQKLIHRATFAFVKNSRNYFYVQKRSMLKDYCPGFYDPTPGGVVAFGETFEQTNAREIEEEMGIVASSTQMQHLFTFFYEDDRVCCFGDAWELTYDGKLSLQVEEVESVELMSMADILRKHEEGYKFTPDSIFACKEYVKRYGLPLAVN